MAGLRILIVAVIGMWCSTAIAQGNKSNSKKAATDKAKSEALNEEIDKAAADTSGVKKEKCIIRFDEIDYTKDPE